MVDAALGGKTGVDLKAGKNLAGVFAPPKTTFIDPAWLITLPGAGIIAVAASELATLISR